MPKELLRIDRPMTWLRTIIRRRTFGIETEFHFNDNDTLLSVAIGRMVESEFLHEVMEIDCLMIREYSKQERGWTEDDGFEIDINYDDDIAHATTRGPFVRFGPLESQNSNATENTT